MVVYIDVRDGKQKLCSSGKEIEMKSIEGMEVKHIKFVDRFIQFTLKAKK